MNAGLLLQQFGETLIFMSDFVFAVFAFLLLVVHIKTSVFHYWPSETWLATVAQAEALKMAMKTLLLFRVELPDKII